MACAEMTASKDDPMPPPPPPPPPREGISGGGGQQARGCLFEAFSVTDAHHVRGVQQQTIQNQSPGRITRKSSHRGAAAAAAAGAAGWRGLP